MLNLPNIITIIRIILVPVFLVIFWSANPFRVYWGMAVLALAGLTDVVDGHIARKYNQVTRLGKILDPMADKLMVITVMTSLFLIGRFPLWLVGLILVKETVVAVGGFFLVIKEKVEVSASIYGKMATITIYMALFAAAFDIPGCTFFAVIAGLISILALTTYINSFIRRRQY